MAIILYSENIKKMLSPQIFTPKRRLLYFFLGLIIPTVISLLPVINMAYSPDEYLCWITTNHSASLCDPKYFEIYGPFYLSYH